MTGFPTLRRTTAPLVMNVARVREAREDKERVARGDPKDYDWRWEQLARAFRKAHPFCRFCEQAGKLTGLADSVDHIIPFTYAPSLKYERSNLESLCNKHHFGAKAKIERICERLGTMDDIPRYCASLEERQKLFQNH